MPNTILPLKAGIFCGESFEGSFFYVTFAALKIPKYSDSIKYH
jgi:hypothetical protein